MSIFHNCIKFTPPHAKSKYLLFPVLLICFFCGCISNPSSPHEKVSTSPVETIVSSTDNTSSLSFYQKLNTGDDVNILIVGDSIGAGSGASDGSFTWPSILCNHLQKTYGCNVSLTNVSMGGNTSYAGYARVMSISDNIDYDLAVICYGQNDNEKNFSMYYESIIRAIVSRYPYCSIISILESSQREYTYKMQIIQAICAYYAIPVADTIAPFTSNYDELTGDGVHPNDTGYQIYADAVIAIIDDLAKKDTKLIAYSKSPINADVVKFNQGEFIPVSAFTRISATTYSINTSSNGILGLYYNFVPGYNQITVSTDSNLIVQQEFEWTYSFMQSHIDLVAEACNIEKCLEISFSTKEHADYFWGVIFSHE